MKKLWTIASFLFIANGLAVILFVVWLITTGRLDMDRVYAIREMVATTIEDEQAEVEAAAEAEANAAEELRITERLENPQPPSAVKIGYSDQIDQIGRDRARRETDDIARLKREMELERNEIDRDRADLDKERTDWQSQQAVLAGQSNNVQFKQVVKMLEGLPPKQAKGMLVQMMTEGEAGKATSYLNAMKPYTSTKIIREFKTDDEKRMATELLNRLATLGSEPTEDETTDDADSASQPG